MRPSPSQLVKNLGYLAGAETVSKLATFLALAYLARVLGPAEYGYVEFAAAVILCASIIVDQGFGPYGAREIAKSPERTMDLVSEIVTARFFLAIIAYASVIVFARVFVASSVITLLLTIYGVSLLGVPLLLQWVFQGHNQMSTVAAIQTVRQAAFCVIVLVLVRSAGDLWWAAVAEIAGVCVAAAFGLWTYRTKICRQVHLQLTFTKQLFREGVPIGLSQMFWMVRMFGATVIIGLIAVPEDVGYFAVSMRILVALHAFIWLYFFNLLPSLSQAWQKGDGTFVVLVNRSLHLVTWLCAIGASIWVLAAPTVVSSVYGPAFAPAGPVLQWLAGVAVAAGLSGHYRFGLIAAGRQNAEMVAQLIGSALALVFMILGYSYGGLSGSAVGLVIAETVVWGITWRLANSVLGIVSQLNHFVAPLIAIGLAVSAPWILPSSVLILQIAFVTLIILLVALTLDAKLREDLVGLGTAWHLP